MNLKSTDIYHRFVHLSVVGQMPTNDEWERMETALCEAYPRFSDFMMSHRLQLSSKEHRACLLIRMGMRPSTVGHMLGTSAAYVSKLRSEMARKFFGAAASAETFDRRLQEMS